MRHFLSFGLFWASMWATACGSKVYEGYVSRTDAGWVDSSSPMGSSSGFTSSSGSGSGPLTGSSTGSGSFATSSAGSGESSSGSSSAGSGESSSGSSYVGGGESSSGSSSAGSGGADAGNLSPLSPQEFVKAMAPGWNLGNTFDADPSETSWGSPETTQAMVQAVHAAGFNTMRIPVTWTDHIGAPPTYTIDPAWMAKVQQVATWANEAGMFAIVNTHHDADGQWILFNDPGTSTTTLSATNQARITAEIAVVWTQIATAFRSYGDHLILECFNEPHGNVNGYGGGDAASRTILNSYLAACMNAIRGTGGNSATRYVMVQGLGAAAVQVSIQAVVVPNSDPNILFSVHNYFPWSFASASTTTWGTTPSDYTDMSGSVEQTLSWLPPSEGIVLGEWGSVTADRLTSRVAHASAYAQDMAKAGMCPVVWDDGGEFILLDRTSNPPSWRYPTILSAMMAGYKAGAAPGATYAQFP
jgi:endoglucanase